MKFDNSKSAPWRRTSKWRNGLMLGALLALGTNISAQVNTYTFSQPVGTFTPITGGTVLGSTTSDDQRFVTPVTPLGGTTTTGIGFPIGFDLFFNGQVYNRVAVNTNGWLSFGNSALTPSVNNASTSSYTPLASTSATTPTHLRSRIAAMARDLQGQAGSEMRIQTIGTTPNQVCVVQWLGMRRYGAAGESFNFQARLNEVDNTVEVVFGSMTWSATSNTCTIGLGGTTVADFNSRKTTTNWNATTASSVVGDVCYFGTSPAVTVPVSGTSFKWTPGAIPTCFGPTALATTTVASTSASFGWGAPSTGTPPVVYNWKVVLAGAGSAGAAVASGSTAGFTATAGSLTANTSYDIWVQSNCGSETSSYAGPVNFFTGYCPSTRSGVTTIRHITNFVTTGGVTNISNPSGGISPSGYGDFTAQSVSQFETGLVNFTISCSTDPDTYGIGVWVDLNNDLDFSDPGETMYLSTTYMDTPFSNSFTVPLGTPIGSYRMRVKTDWLAGIPPPCGTTSTNCETEDYTLNVVAPPTCQAPTGVTAINPTTDGADVSWTCVTCSVADDFVVEYGAPGFTPGTGIAAGAGGTVWTGTVVSGSSVTLTGLSGLTAYSVVVRERCGPGEFSANSSVANFATLCGGTTCDYMVRFADLYGDGWDNSEWQVKQNGVVVATIGPQLLGCGDGVNDYMDIPVTICEGATVTLEWTNLGNYPDEKALQFYNPFGVLLYDHRGTGPYTNCPGANWTSANSAGTTGVKFTTTSNCTPPTCSVTPSFVDDCLAGTYDITLTDIDVTGNGTIQYSLNGVAQDDVDFTPPSTTIAGIDVAQAAFITLVTDDGCTNEIGNVQSACAVELDCAATSPLPFQHCYSNGDTRTWYFHTPEVGGAIDLKFLPGSELGAGDNVIFWNGVPGASVQIGSYSGDMSNLTFTGQTNQYLGVSITTNGSGSCEDGLDGTAWNFTVRCSGCTEPLGLVLLPPDNGEVVDCTAGTFEASVYVESFGINGTGPNAGSPPATTTISWTAGGVAQLPIVLTQTSDESGLLTSLGSWPLGVEIDVTLLHGNGETVCNNPIGSDLTIPLSACPPPNDDCANAITITVGAPGSCPASGIGGDTFGASMTGAQPSCATGTVSDVWYFMDTNGFAQPSMSVTGATGPIGLELYTACGGVAGICNNDLTILTQPFTFNVPPDQYYMRFYTLEGNQSAFTVCVEAEPAGYECDGAINIPSAPVTNQSLVCSSVPSPGILNATNVPVACGSASNSYKGANEALYTFTPSVSGNYAISYTGLSWSSIFVYADACPTNLGTCVGSAGSSATAVSLVVALNFGTTYYVWFDNWPSPNESPCPGTFSLQLIPPAPANDDCAAAIPLDATSLTCTPTDGNTASATQSFAGCSGTANDDVWYSFLATETSHVIRVNGYGTFDPVFELFDGGSDPGVCPVAGPGITCQNATGAANLETFTAVGLSIGNRYFVRVYDSGTGISYSTAPSFNICVTRLPLCTPPTATAATGITTGTANATWTPNPGGSGTNFIVEYGLASNFTTPGTGLTNGANGTVILGATSPQSLGALSDNTQYRYFVRQNCEGTGDGFSANSNAVTFTTLSLPTVNDNCAQAISLANNNFTCVNISGTALGATQSQPATCGGTADDDVWYKFVALGANYSLSVDGNGDYDGVLEVFSSTGSCASLVSMGCTDGTFGGGVETKQLIGLDIGATYYARTYHWYSTAATDPTFSVCLVRLSDCLPPSGITTSNVTASSADVNVPGSPTANYVLEYGLQSNFTVPGVDGTAGTNGTVIAFTGNLQQIPGLAVTTGYRYFVRRDCGSGIYTANVGGFTFTTLGLPPANDLCTNAIPVTCGNTYTGTNVNATDDGLPSLAGTTFNPTITNGVWWKYVGDDQTVTLSLCASSFDTRIHVWSGSCGSPVGVGGNDDDCGLQSEVTFGAALGTTYYIVVEGYGTSSGSINMVVTCGPYCAPPANSACTSAQSITPSPVGFCNPVAGTTACAESSGGANPTCAATFQTYQDVYYTFTAAGSAHPMQVNEVVPGTLSFWALYEAACGGQQDFCSTTFNSPVSVTGLTPGAVYKIRIGSQVDADFDI
ncbi:MAG: hypothetical protein IPH21_16635 [Flavobacteriales bacterium]|nr:hypothetical protein [Flavobacteriales bacterium]